MSANFTPDMKGYSGIRPFRFWCQKVLPLVYDDSLSYYELLCKVVDYLNNTIADVANVEDNVDGLLDAYNQLQDYVNNYFASLDVAAEIERELDEMASDGRLTALISPLMPELIGDWLEEHITPTSPPLDNTFTVPNAAAESVAVGNMFEKTMVTRGSVVQGADLDDMYHISGMYYVARNTSGTVNSSPWEGVPYTLFVKAATTQDAASGQQQIAFNHAGRMAYRMRYVGAWEDWNYINPDEIGALTMATRGSLHNGDDLNTYYDISGMYYASRGVSQQIVNGPWYNKAYTLFVKCSSTPTSQSGQTQYAFTIDGMMAYRTRFAESWGEWKYVANENQDNFISMSLFERVGVCGGSYDCGASRNPDGTSAPFKLKNAWLNILGREYGFTAGIYAYPGCSIPEWFDTNYVGASYTYSLFNSEDGCELYFLTFGANDTIDGSTADCASFDADPSSTPTTFYGWYSKLLYTVKQKAPTARIVICYPSSTGIIASWETARNAIKEIADYYEMPVLDLTQNNTWREHAKYLCQGNESGSSLHPTPYGFAFLANAYDSAFSNLVIYNPEYFKDWRN